jgi:opacity protein-like surface antigen
MSQKMRGVVVLVVVSVALAMSAVAQQWDIPPVSSETHALDSLLGRWTYVEDLHNPQYPQVKGLWTFYRSADGFMVIDEFRNFNGTGGTAVLVETYRAYNPDKKTWSFQTAGYQSRMIGLKNGEWDAGVTRIQDGQIFDEVTKGSTVTRARFYNLKKGSFSCVFETSNDGGKTWVNPVDIEAVRAAQD